MRAFVSIGILALIGATTVAAVRPARDQQDLEMLRAGEAPPNAIWIDSLDLSKMVQRRQTPRAGRSLAGGRGGGRGAGEAGGPQGAPISSAA
jgi:hypothetical protein